MILKKASDRNFYEENVKIHFALVPIVMSNGDIVLFEKYYYYSDCQCAWKQRTVLFDNKEDFFHEIVEGGRE